MSKRIVVIGGGLSFMHAVDDNTHVTAIVGNDFLEWSIAATYFLVNDSKHMDYVCPNMADWKKPGVEYIVGTAASVNASEKTVTVTGESKEQQVPYDALVVATGSRLPYVNLQPGIGLAGRQQQVKQFADAIRAANTIVLNGPGAVGLEMAGDIRAVYPEKKVILLSRSGNVMGTHPEKLQKKFADQLKKMEIEVIKATVDRSMTEPILTPGTLELSDVDEKTPLSLKYDVYVPCYQQGPNTDFLRPVEGILNQRGQIKVNDRLQSMVHPEVFAVGTSDSTLGHPIAGALTAQSKTVAANVNRFLQGQDLKAHAPPKMGTLERPMNVKIGHGSNGYMFWDLDMLPAPLKICCCLPCGGGKPCCPPPCCWCCCSPGACGNCCGEPEGSGPAAFILKMNPKFPGMHGFKGLGTKPKNQVME